MRFCVLMFLSLPVGCQVAAQSKKATTEREQPLVLTEAIPLENTKGQDLHGTKLNDALEGAF